MNVGVDNAAVAVTVVDGSKVVVVGENAVAASLLRTVATAMAMGDDHIISFGVILVDDRRGRSRRHLDGRKLSFRTANCIHDDSPTSSGAESPPRKPKSPFLKNRSRKTVLKKLE